MISYLLLCLVMQACLAFGVAGLVWPEKFMPVYGVLMFPWPASYRAIRANGLVVIGAYLFVMGKIVTTGF
ncbi:MAG: hypothetical protein WAM79_22205 [Candidatus Sulfotelmatobacter sp.]